MSMKFNLIFRTLCALSVLFFVSCSSLPTYSGQGEGRFVIYSDTITESGATKAWWDYQVWYRDVVTDEKGIMLLTINRGEQFHVSEALLPGKYEIYEMNVKYKGGRSVTRDYDLNYEFEVFEQGLTYFGLDLIVTVDSESQGWGWRLAEESDIKTRVDEWLGDSEEAKDWKVYLPE